MLVRFNQGVVTSGPAFEPGDVVDWLPPDEAKRYVEKGYAEAIKPEEAKAAGLKVKSYTSPPKKPEQAWPPKEAPRKRRDRGDIEND